MNREYGNLVFIKKPGTFYENVTTEHEKTYGYIKKYEYIKQISFFYYEIRDVLL